MAVRVLILNNINFTQIYYAKTMFPFNDKDIDIIFIIVGQRIRNYLQNY